MKAAPKPGGRGACGRVAQWQSGLRCERGQGVGSIPAPANFFERQLNENCTNPSTEASEQTKRRKACARADRAAQLSWARDREQGHNYLVGGPKDREGQEAEGA